MFHHIVVASGPAQFHPLAVINVRKMDAWRLKHHSPCDDRCRHHCPIHNQPPVSTCCSVRSIDTVPNSILGAAWRVHKERMDAAIYFPLFLVLASSSLVSYSIFYL